MFKDILFSIYFLIFTIPTLPDNTKRQDSNPHETASSILSPFHCILTIIKVNVLWDLVPGAVVEMADLFLILHHACWFAFLLVFQGNVVLDGFKVLPMLKKKIKQIRILKPKLESCHKTTQTTWGTLGFFVGN